MPESLDGTTTAGVLQVRRFHHIGIPTSERRPEEKELPEFGMHVSGFEGQEILIPPNSPSPGIRVAFIVHNGAPVEFLEIAEGLEFTPPVVGRAAGLEQNVGRRDARQRDCRRRRSAAPSRWYSRQEREPECDGPADASPGWEVSAT
jgi:hypothetical protein